MHGEQEDYSGRTMQQGHGSHCKGGVPHFSVAQCFKNWGVFIEVSAGDKELDRRKKISPTTVYNLVLRNKESRSEREERENVKLSSILDR